MDSKTSLSSFLVGTCTGITLTYFLNQQIKKFQSKDILYNVPYETHQGEIVRNVQPTIKESSSLKEKEQEQEQEQGQGHNEHFHATFHHQRLSIPEIQHRSLVFLKFMKMRRTIRFFSSETFPLSILENCIRTAGTSPSGAHQQPWTFCVVQNSKLKESIRMEVEKEEQLNYERRMRRTWVSKVEDLVSDLPEFFVKPYLTQAPYIIVMMKHAYNLTKEGEREEVYYPEQSCGIAAGMLITALHNANLVTLTSTPMGAEKSICQILNRPKNEKVFLLLPVGFPSNEATVPYRKEENMRKDASSIMKVYA